MRLDSEQLKEDKLFQQQVKVRAKFCSTFPWYESEAMSCKSKNIIPDLFLIGINKIRHHLGLGSCILHTKYLRLFATR